MHTIFMTKETILANIHAHNWCIDLVTIKITTGIFKKLGKLILYLYGKVKTR